LPRALVADSRDVLVTQWVVPPDPGAPGAGEPVSFQTMCERAEFDAVTRGHAWGRPWSTSWFRLEGRIPAEWEEAGNIVPTPGRMELSVDLGFDDIKPGFQVEGLIRTAEGTAIKGLEPRNHHVPVAATPGQNFV